MRVEPLRRELDQSLARGRRRLPDLHAATLDAVRTGGAALVGRKRGVAFHVFDLVDADAELLGCDLRHGDAQTLAQIDFAAVERDGAVAVHCQEGVDFLGVENAAGCLRRCAQWHSGKRKADGERAALEHGAAGEAGGFDGDIHVSLPVPMPP